MPAIRIDGRATAAMLISSCEGARSHFAGRAELRMIGRARASYRSPLYRPAYRRDKQRDYAAPTRAKRRRRGARILRHTFADGAHARAAAASLPAMSA